MPEQNTSLVARDITMTYGARRVLDGNDISVTPGQRVGLVGENGTGKSTFLRILAGVEEPDRGTVERPEDLAYLPQVPEFPADATVGSVLDDALAEQLPAFKPYATIDVSDVDDCGSKGNSYEAGKEVCGSLAKAMKGEKDETASTNEKSAGSESVKH